jgi:Tfp pilus assembly protein PilF
MCSECHSTNLKKNFDPIKKSFHTTYSEINVSCEACHGPGSKHVEWAKLPEDKRTQNNDELVAKTKNISNREYVEICARCHSRRSQFDNFEHGRKHLLDSMLPELLTENYYPDGQILDEDYVYCSFLQSKMYANDVKCNDCHNVHSGKILYKDNRLCHKCHEPNIYDTKKHHFHKYKGEKGKPIILSDRKIEVGEGALCVNCHMPGQYYMGIDFRRDHSIRIPRPDLTISINTPNACNNCHSNKSPQWANNYVNKWYKTKRKQHYGTTFALARKSEPKAEKDLIKIAKNKMLPIIVRATAFSLMSRYSSKEIKKTVQSGLKDSEASIREAALRVYSNSNIIEFKKDLLGLLNDSVKAVRAEAAIRISELPKNEIPTDYLKSFNKALLEYKEMNLYMSDFPSARMNLGIMYANQNKLVEAAKQYEEAIKIDSLFFPAKANLAIIYNQLGKNDKSETLLRDLIKNHPELPESYYYLGLLLAERKNFVEAIKYMKKASELMPERARINYNVGLMLQNIGRKNEAEKELLKALKKEPNNFDFLYALTDHYIKRGKYSKAKKIAMKIKKSFPTNSLGNELLKFIEDKLEK